MLTKIINKKMIFILLIILILFGISVRNADNELSAQGITGLNMNGIVNQHYQFGDELNIPTATISYGENEYDAVSVLYKPDGNVFSGNSLILDIGGKYELQYRALLINGQLISKIQSFLVSDELYSVSSENSNIRYGVHEKYAANQQGIIVSLAKNDVFTYNKIIDLNNKTRYDNILRMFVTPLNIGVADVQQITVKFIDIHNPENVVKIIIHDGTLGGDWGYSYVYMQVNAPNQYPAGYEGYGTNIYHVNGIYGTVGLFSMAGENLNNTPIGEQYIDVSWNYIEKKVYGSKFTIFSPLISDLDDPDCYANLWKGFSTGEAYMTIEAAAYQSNSFNFVITNINNEDISTNTLYDELAPELEIDYDGYDANSSIETVVNKPFKIFKANAQDLNEENTTIITGVYKDYQTQSQTVCNINDGYFTPQKVGNYTIVYTAADKFGNIATKTVDVLVNENINELSVAISGKLTAGKCGEEIKICSDLIVLNSIGNIEKTIIARIPGNNLAVYDVNKDTLKFRPMYSGIYVVEYSVADYIDNINGRISTINVSNNNQPIIIDNVNLPKYFIKNATYSLPLLNGYEYSQGIPREVSATITVKEDGGTAETLTNSYIVEASSSVQITYTVTANGLNDSVDYTIPVIDTGFGSGNLNFLKFFETVSGLFTSACDDKKITFSTNTDNSTIEYINALQISSFYFNFNIALENNNFNKVNVYLTDSIDSNVKLKFSFIKNDLTGSYFIINDSDTVNTVKANFFGEGNQAFNINYNNDKLIVKTEFQNININTDLNGDIFEGFSSGAAYLKIELSEVNGQAGINIIKINNQSFFNTNEDKTIPEINVYPSWGDRKIGDIIELMPTSTHDVLDPNIILKMYVKDPDKNFVLNIQGQTIDFSINPYEKQSFRALKYGNYIIYYESIDSDNNKAIYSYFIKVTDNVSPIFALGEKSNTAKLNSQITVATYDLKDNITTEMDVYIFVESPRGVMSEVKANTFTASCIGNYTVHYFAYDESFNMAYAGYKITVN